MLQTSSINDSEIFTEVYNECFNAITFKTAENLESKLNNITSNEKPLLFGLTPMKTRIIMHRGYSGNAPDNTVASFTLAGQTSECWGIETDVRVLTDDTLVCFHDTELDSHTNGTGNILDKSYEDILNNDLPPFKSGIDHGAEAVLVSHNIVNSVDSNNPASLSASIAVIHSVSFAYGNGLLSI